MNLAIKHTGEKPAGVRNIFLVRDTVILKDFGFNKDALDFVEDKIDSKKKLITVQSYSSVYHVRMLDDNDMNPSGYEKLRKDGHSIWSRLKEDMQSSVCIYDLVGDKASVLALTEGIALSSYSFDKYKTDIQHSNSSK